MMISMRQDLVLVCKLCRYNLSIVVLFQGSMNLGPGRVVRSIYSLCMQKLCYERGSFCSTYFSLRKPKLNDLVVSKNRWEIGR